MRSKREQGATMALTAAIALVLVMIGFAFFFVAKMLGGGSELQHQTDSGNLNVAKQALRSPKLNVFGPGPYDISNSATVAEIQRNFSLLQDPANGQLDLLVYNRLVAQALLVALNAADENTPAAKADAQAVIALLTDPNFGVGPNLTKKLTSDPALDDSFTQLASLGNLRMLAPGSSEQDTPALKDVSYMLSPNGGNAYAGNVYFNLSSIPASQQTNFYNTYTVQKTFNSPDPNPGTFNYIAGYEALNVPGVTGNGVALMGVPLRPHQNPHIVDGTDFETAKISPLAITGGVANSAVPPNAFKAGGRGINARTLEVAQAISCAITGAITGQADYQAAISCGVIAVANGFGTNPTPTTPGPIGFSSQNYVFPAVNLPGQTSNDIFGGVLMSGGGGAYVSQTMTATAVSLTAGCINQLENDLYYYSVNGHYPASWTQDQACLLGSTKNTDALSLPAIESPNGDEILCNNINIFDGSAPACAHAYGNGSGFLVTDLGGNLFSGSSSTTSYSPVSAVESVKAQAIDARSQGNSVTVTLPGGATSIYSGMTAFPLDNYLNLGQSANGTPLPAPSLNSLLGTTSVNPNLANNGNFPSSSAPSANGNAPLMYGGLIQRMYEIKPSLKFTDPDVANVLNTTLTPGTALFIWVDGNNKFNITNQAAYTNDTTLPYHIDLNNLQADGSPVTVSTTLTMIGYTNAYVDLSGEAGYDHPWDCAPSTGTSTSTAIWTPSTGKDCLLGIMRFYNFVDLGTTSSYTFDCPC
jgi:hypothetical protein